MEWRCVVCGKKVTADHRPEACPMCGVTEEYFVLESEYEKPTDVLSEEATADFDRAMELETEAVRIYAESAERAKARGASLTGIFFEALTKNEKGHQTAIRYQKGL